MKAVCRRSVAGISGVLAFGLLGAMGAHSTPSADSSAPGREIYVLGQRISMPTAPATRQPGAASEQGILGVQCEVEAAKLAAEVNSLEIQLRRAEMKRKNELAARLDSELRGLRSLVPPDVRELSIPDEMKKEIDP